MVPGSIWDTELQTPGTSDMVHSVHTRVTEDFSTPPHLPHSGLSPYPIHSAHAIRELQGLRDLKRVFLVSPVATAGGQR